MPNVPSSSEATGNYSVNIGPYRCDSSTAITHSAAVNVYFGRRPGSSTEYAVRRARPGFESLVKEEGETREKLSRDPYLARHMPRLVETFQERSTPVVVVERIKDFVALNQGANRLSKQQRLQLAQELVEYVNHWHKNGLTINDIGNGTQGHLAQPDAAWRKADRFCLRLAPGGKVDWWDLDANITASITPFYEACQKAESAVKTEPVLQARQKAMEVLRLSSLKENSAINQMAEKIEQQLSSFRTAENLKGRATDLLKHKGIGARILNLFGMKSFEDIRAAEYRVKAQAAASGDGRALKALIQGLGDELLESGIDYSAVIDGKIDAYLLSGNGADNLLRICRLVASLREDDWLMRATKLGYISASNLGDLDQDRVGPVAADIREQRQAIYSGLKIDGIAVPEPNLRSKDIAILSHGRYQSPERLAQIIQEELKALDQFPRQAMTIGGRYVYMIAEEYQAITSIVSQLLYRDPNAAEVQDIRQEIKHLANTPSIDLSDRIAQRLQMILSFKSSSVK